MNIIPTITTATDDWKVISMWLSGKRKGTQRLYATVFRQFFQFVAQPLVKVVLDDLVLWIDSLELHYSQNSIKLKVSIVKSLFSYAWKIGYLSVNIAKAVSAPSAVDALHERLLEQSEVKKLIAAASPRRDRTLLTLIYSTGLRASEALGIDWKDLLARAKGGQVTVMGKGGKVRTVLLSQSLWQQIMALPSSAKTDAVFITRSGNRLDRHRLHRIIKAAANRAGVNPHVSTHWLRHAHACHSLENGCDIDVSREKPWAFEPDRYLEVSTCTTRGGVESIY